MKADLHVHGMSRDISSYSGDLGPFGEDILELERKLYNLPSLLNVAVSRGLDMIALTDFGHMGSFKVVKNDYSFRCSDDPQDWEGIFNYNGHCESEFEKEEIDKSSIRIKNENWDKPLVVLKGEEINTLQGEVIGIGLESLIEPGQRLKDTIDEIARQGAIIQFPHPLATFPGAGGIGLQNLEEAIDYCNVQNYPQMTEIKNGNLASPLNYFNYKTKKLVEKHLSDKTICVGNSDARGHTSKQWKKVGSIYTDFTELEEPSRDALRDYVLKKGKTEIYGKENNIFIVGAMMAPVVLKKIFGS